MGLKKDSLKNVTFVGSSKKLNNGSRTKSTTSSKHSKITEMSDSGVSKSGNPGPLLKKKDLTKVLKTEYDYISKLFDVLDVDSLNHGRRNMSDDEDSEGFEVMDVPEKKIFKKGSKSGNSQPSGKTKSFPHSIEGLKKELDEQKGKPKTYQDRLRIKGLQTRLLKKKRKMERKQQKSAKKNKSTIGGTVKLKPVFNNDGNIVSNKFDFADSEVKMDGKRKASTDADVNRESKMLKPGSPTKKKNKNIPPLAVNGYRGTRNLTDSFTSNDISLASRVKFESTSTKVKTENLESNSTNVGNKASSQQGPIFNKENKIVFSKVYVPEKNKKHKKKFDKDPKRILQKIRDDSQKISELEKEDKEKAASLKEKLKWTAALKRAGGEKVRDDPELLKKTISREKHKKAHSKKKWQTRIDRVQKEKDDKQKKRTDNIQARKLEKKKKKMKRAIKKGSFVQL